MRNVLDEKPTTELHGRLKYAAAIVEDADLCGRQVLDIGCGFGWFELNVLARGVASIVGTELSEADLKTINRHLQDPRLSTRVGSALDLPFEQGSFDTVVCWEVLEHLPRGTEPQFFAQVARVLKTGGRFYLSTPHGALLSTVADPAWWLIGHRHYTTQRLHALARDGGFQVDQLELRGGVWDLAALLNLYFSKWILRRRPVAEAAFTKRVDDEYTRPGFAGLFVKMTRM